MNKSTLHTFIHYITIHKKHLYTYLCVFSIFTIVLTLYSVSIEPIVYSIILSLTLLFLVTLYNFKNYSHNHLRLMSLQNQLTTTIDSLPQATPGISEDYHNLVLQLIEKQKGLISKNHMNHTELVDYYTLWAHQIKTPIAAMRLLLQSSKTENDKALLIQLFKIEQYVEMVLSFLRLESPSSDFLFKSYDLDKIIKQCIKKYAPQFIAQKITLIYEPLNTQIITDEKWLVFALEQVLSNALKYTKEGSISISLLTDTSTSSSPLCDIFNNLNHVASKQVLVIQDSGIGISLEDLPRIFEKGFTGYNGRRDKKATGIGLYLTKKILNKLSNSIYISSTLDLGTTVFIDLSKDLNPNLTKVSH